MGDHPYGVRIECPTCRGRGTCLKCYGDSATVTYYGVTKPKYFIYSKIVDGINTAMTPEEFKDANDASKRQPCGACSSSGQCPRCGITGKITIPN